MVKFTTDYNALMKRIASLDPVNYGKTRNFTDGDVTYLSPYISRGFISVKQVLDIVLNAGYKPYQIKTFIQELAWRDYWQLKWQVNKNLINHDLIHQQPSADFSGIPESLLNHHTGIVAIDEGIESLYQTGYMHNHLRMYVSSIACNIARCHWKIPAQWMYYYLLDGDWGSNALSWQWICGSTRQTLYYANQENINKYCSTSQTHTFLDTRYEDLPAMDVPEILTTRLSPLLITPLPETTLPLLEADLPTLVYNYYNVDPLWRNDLAANKILLLEPSVFKEYPVSQKSLDFCIELAIKNIPGIQVWVAEFAELQQLVKGDLIYKEHPLNNYTGQQDSRDWLTSLKGDFNSFFSFWKKSEKQLF